MDPLTRLASRARRGDVEALDSFVAATYDQVWRFCASLVGRQAADDAVQETFVRAVRSLPSYRAESSARTWLLAVARHVCLDEWRDRERRRLAGTRVAPQAAVDDAGQEVAIADLVERLDPDRRAAFVLTRLLGLTYDEAATVCSCPVGTIRSRVARARRDLMTLLEAAGTEGAASGGGRSSTA